MDRITDLATYTVHHSHTQHSAIYPGPNFLHKIPYKIPYTAWVPLKLSEH